MSNNYILDIDLNKVDKTIKEVNKLQRKIDKAINDGIKELSDKMRARAILNLQKYGLGTSKLINELKLTPMDGGINISIGTDYAFFVEYGTGIKGENKPHPKAMEVGWDYDVNEHGDYGWWYPTTMDNPYFIKHKVRYVNGTPYAWTKGMESRPFMYETWLYGRRIATKTINKHLRSIK
jgi:hypothetical protein